MTFQEIAEIAASVIVSLGGGGAIVFGLSSYLGKRWADRALENQRQEHAKLNLEITHELGLLTEQRKIILQIKATEHRVRYTKLHEKRALVIADLYERFVTAYWAAQTYHQWTNLAGGPTDDEQANSAWKSLHKAYRFFEKNRIFLSATLSDELDAFFTRAKTLTLNSQYFSAIPNKTQETAKLHFDARREGLEAFTKEFPEMRKRLDVEFKRLLEPDEGTAT